MTRTGTATTRTATPDPSPSPSCSRWTLPTLRPRPAWHSALTHLGANGCTAVELQAKGRHASRRTLGRYVNPGPELAARVTAETDPAARRRNRPAM